MAAKSFSVRIFLQDGHVDGVKLIAKSKWPGRGLVIPRTSLPEEISRIELNAPGVYILVGPSAEGDLPIIYIGSANPVCSDLQRHNSQKVFWNRVLVFASKNGSLEQAHFQYLEARLIRLAQGTQRSNLVNQNNPKLPELAETELAEAESFLEHLLSVCPLFGLFAFEQVNTNEPTS